MACRALMADLVAREGASSLWSRPPRGLERWDEGRRCGRAAFSERATVRGSSCSPTVDPARPTERARCGSACVPGRRPAPRMDACGRRGRRGRRRGRQAQRQTQDGAQARRGPGQEGQEVAATVWPPRAHRWGALGTRHAPLLDAPDSRCVVDPHRRERPLELMRRGLSVCGHGPAAARLLLKEQQQARHAASFPDSSCRIMHGY